MNGYTWRELERADMDDKASHAVDMEYRAEQKRLARIEHIVTCSECIYCASPKFIRWCAMFGAYKPSADGFCAWGERRRS